MFATLLVATQAQATIAYDFPELPGNMAYTGVPLALGEVFTVNSSIFVTHLAAYDDPANGYGNFGAPVSVAIYRFPGSTIDTAGTLVVNPLTFQTGDAGNHISGQATAVKPVPGGPVELSPGTYMIVANNYGGQQGNENGWDYTGGAGPTANTEGVVTYGENYYNGGNPSLVSPFPGGWADAGSFATPRFMAGNFEFFTPVPEVTAFGAAAVGLLGLVYIGRYARLRRKMKIA